MTMVLRTSAGRLLAVAVAAMALMPQPTDGARSLKLAGAQLSRRFVDLDAMGCNGSDLDHARVSDRRACEALCDAEELCQAYSFAIASRKCYLKAEPCVGANRDINPNNLSGMRLPATPEPTAAPVETTVVSRTPPPPSRTQEPNSVPSNDDFEGSSIFSSIFGGILPAEPSAPAPEANSLSGLFGGAFSSVAAASSSRSESQAVTVAGASQASGSSVPETLPAVIFARLPPGIGCRGHSIAKERALDVQQCEEMCGEVEGCMAYSFNTESGKCFLKGDTCTPERQDRNAGHNLSGIRQALQSFVLENRRFTRLDSVGCNGKSLSTVDALSRAECEDLCRDDADCMAYSFAITARRCFLKAETCDAFNQDVNRDNLSGTVIV